MESLNLFFFAFALFLTVVAMARLLDKTRSEGEFLPGDRWERALLLCFALVALFVRVYQFGQVPGGFNQDGAMAAIDAKALADYGTDHYGMRYPVHLTAWGYGQMSALLSYLMVPFIKLMGLNPVSARLPQLLVSLLGLGMLYFFGRDAFGKKAALVIFAFAAITPWHILQSRWALDCNLYPHFFLFGVYFLNRSLRARHRKLLLCLSMVMFGLCMYCYGIAIYTLPLFLLLACVYLLAKRKVRWDEALLALAVWLAVAWPFIMVMAINFFQWDTIETPLFTLPYFSGSIRSGDILFFSENVLAQLWENIKSLQRTVFAQGNDLPWNNIPAFGSIYQFSLPFAVLGFVYTLLQVRKNDAAVLLLFFFITGLWCGISTNGVNINRVNIIFYPQIIFTALGIDTVLRRVGRFPLHLGLAAVYLVSFALLCSTYFGSYAREMEYYFFKDFGSALSTLKDSEADKIYITGRSQGENAGYVSEVLTLFYHETDAEYFQGKRELPGLLPYEQRFTYANMEDIRIDPEENAAYVAAAEELVYFDIASYDIQQYGNYFVLRSID